MDGTPRQERPRQGAKGGHDALDWPDWGLGTRPGAWMNGGGQNTVRQIGICARNVGCHGGCQQKGMDQASSLVHRDSSIRKGLI
jgi:hypothetical protein